MHFTRRLLERHPSTALVLVACVTVPAAAASCSSADGGPESELTPEDGGADQPHPGADSGPDVTAPDAGSFDGGPLPVVCASAPCATALVTTRGANASDRGEGFCALLNDGTVACWGAGSAGQLGRGADDGGIADSAMAERVPGLTKIVSLDHTCAVDEAGGVYCWGTGPFLQDPLVATTTERSPVKLALPPATQVGVGATTGCAVIESGVVCWGSNARGQVAPLDSAPFSAVLAARNVELPPGAPVRQLVVGETSFAVRMDGTVVSWGANPPLGRESSLFPDPYPLAIGLTDVTTVDVADNNACTTRGGVGFCWGTVLPDPTAGFIHESRLERALPTPVPAPEPLVQIATTRTTDPTGARRWCACAAGGDVYCWGANASGQAGDGTLDHAHEPVKVAGLPAPAAAVRTTPNTTCALLTTGKVLCWGTNYYGQLGNGKISEVSLTPKEVMLP